MLSARSDVTDRIVGLEVGAWDYLPKPFEPRELLARVRSLLRRPGGRGGNGANGLCFAGWVLDVEGRRLRDPAGRPVALTESDHLLLTAFAEPREARWRGPAQPEKRLASRSLGEG